MLRKRVANCHGEVPHGPEEAPRVVEETPSRTEARDRQIELNHGFVP